MKILFVGGGNMASAMIAGLIKNNENPQNIFVVETNREKCETLKSQFGIHAHEKMDEITTSMDVILLAIKPQDAKTVCESLAIYLKGKTPLIISVMAGITTLSLQKWLGERLPMVRAMPNTAAFIQESATGLFANPRVSEKEKVMVEKIMKGIGPEFAWITEEKQMNAITALSGSGPAYYFYFMECMEKAAIHLGLPNTLAKHFALQTAYGAAKLAANSEEDFSTLRAKVTSKGGTTQAALDIMEKSKIDHIIETALKAADQRGFELSCDLEKDE